MKFRISILIAFVLTTALLLSGASAQGANPVLFYSDLDSGPASGGENNAGVYVSIYGNNFGSSQGSSFVTIGNTPAVNYKVWKNNQIAFQVPNTTPAGSQPITITVSGVASNAVPFTVRAGNIYCVSTTGNDASPGTFSLGCWKTIQHAVDVMAAGDTTYVRQGVSEARLDSEGSVQIGINNNNNGTDGKPMALGGYPGETATIGSSGTGICTQTNCYEGLQTVLGPEHFDYWTVFNLSLRGQQFGLLVNGTNTTHSTHWRVIGNDISCPYMNAASGPYCATFAQTENVWFYGNNVHDIQTYPYNQVPGPEWNGGVYFTTDTNHVWCAWNTVANVQGARGIQVHSSPLGLGNASDPTGHNQYDIHIHDNIVHDIAMDGILFATVDPSKGPVEAYNNIVYNAGKGPNPGGSGYYTGIYIAGYTNNGSVGMGTVELYNNTLYNNGNETINSGSDWGGGIASSASQNGSPNLLTHIRNNIVYQTDSRVRYWTTNCSTGDCTSTSNTLYGANNLFYGAGAPPANPNITGSLNVDPKFVNLTGHDFRLSANSPAATAGTAVPLTSDFDGTPVTVPYPIGACASGSSSSGSSSSDPPPSDPPSSGSASGAVNVSPDTITLAGGQTQQFTVAVTGMTNSSVSWSITPTDGTISSQGLYSAPDGVTVPETIAVTATSLADGSTADTSTITLVPPPQISGIAVSDAGSNAATILWNTNILSDSQVDYGTTTAYGATSTLDSTLTLAHTVLLSNLSPSTTYHFRVRTHDATGQTVLSADNTFTTLAGPAPTPSGFSWTVINDAAGAPSQLQLSWTAPSARTAYDSIILVPVDAPNWASAGEQVTNGALSGTSRFTYPPAPGRYEFRYLYVLRSGMTTSVAHSATLEVGTAGFTVAPSVTTAALRSKLKVIWTAGAGLGSGDRIGLFRVGATNDKPRWSAYTQGAASGAFTVTAPGAAGQYEFRYLTSDGMTEAAKSPAVTVQ